MCHIVLMMPVLSLPVFWLLPLPMALPLYLVIFILSFIIYFKVIEASHCQVQSGKRGMLHQTGEVLESIQGQGRVKIHGEIWQAKSRYYIPKGRKVEVTGIHGLEIEVEQLPPKKKEKQSAHCLI